jgi:cytochrome c
MTRRPHLLAATLLVALTQTACGGTEQGASKVKLAELTPDPARGEKVFVRCQTCHSVETGVNRSGPNLRGIVGQAAGKVPGYAYSPANAGAAITWTPENLYRFLENPQGVIPATRMAFSGIRDPQDRADLIAWLSTQR